MIYGRHKSALPLRLRNNNTGQLGNGFNHKDLGKAAGSADTSPGNSSHPLFQLNNPVKKQKGVAMGEIVSRVGIKQRSLL